MERSNYALISALYASRTRGLYSDIYFPIIKYAILKIYADNASSDHYSSSDAVAEKIFQLFGIKIPNVVIALTVKKLACIQNGNIEIQSYEDGMMFRIVTARFDEEETAYEDKERDFNIHLHEIESEYRAFIKREGSCDDDVSFTQFITQNTENILGYFENETEETLGEQYASMAFFLDFLKRSNNSLYMVANQLFWSSVIAAFLQSERPQVSEEEKGSEAEYYLDTPIVMSLLDLSTTENYISANDVCDIIKSSGGMLKVHPATLEEIKNILNSVTQDGPNVGTAIASACSWRNLLAPQIAKIMLNLRGELEKKLGLMVFPTSMPDCTRTIMLKYSSFASSLTRHF